MSEICNRYKRSSVISITYIYYINYSFYLLQIQWYNLANSEKENKEEKPLLPGAVAFYAGNEPKLKLAYNLGECRDNKKNFY